MSGKSKTFLNTGALLLFCLTTTTLNAGVIYDVDARANSLSEGGVGLDTGIRFNAGDRLSGFVASDDLWSAGEVPRWSNADGLTGDLFARSGDESGEDADTLIGRDWGEYTHEGFTAPFGSLVGKIADSFFLLGTSFDLTVQDSGILDLYFWDSNNYDNSGSIAVSIARGLAPPALASFAVEVPAPACAPLIALGLLGLYRRKNVSA